MSTVMRIIISSLIIFCVFFAWGEARPSPKISASYALVLDASTGEILFEKSGSKKIPPASTVKLLTAMLVLDHASLKDKFRVPATVKNVSPYKFGLKKGEKYRVDVLLKALLLRSANDVAHVLAVGVSGSDRAFARLMNKKAKRLGLKRSNFTNPHGLPSGGKQYVSPRDLAILTLEVKKYPALISILRQRKFNWVFDHSGKKKVYKTRNKLLLSDFSPKVLGKTGYTHRAGRCFAGFTQSGKVPLVVIVLKSKNRWKDVRSLVRWGNSFYDRAIKKNRKRWKKKEISKFQKKLTNLGLYQGAIDGIWGKGTQRALIRFQGLKSLKIDGILGPKTLADLMSV